MYKKHKSYLSIILLIITFSYTSCFEIVEEVNLNDDGTGSFSFTVNMSQSRIQVNSIMLLDSINGRPLPKIEDFKKAIRRLEYELKKDSAISEIKITENWEDYIFSITGNFQNIDALNKAIKNINTIFTPKGYTAELYDNFKYENNIFERLYSYNLINEYNTLSQKDKTAFKNAKYTTVYRFNSPVKSYSNQNALKSKSGKAIMLKVNVRELVTNKKSIKNTIILR